MAFLRRTPGLGPAEARKIVELHELIQDSLLHGPTPLEVFAVIARVESGFIETWERAARRLVQRLRVLGYRVTTSGDEELLVMDFASDRALAGEVERWLDRALEILMHPLPRPARADLILADWDNGLGVELLKKRYGICWKKLLSILRAGLRSRPSRRPRIEERRDPGLVRQALRLDSRQAAELLGVSRWTAWRLRQRRGRGRGEVGRPHG